MRKQDDSELKDSDVSLYNQKFKEELDDMIPTRDYTRNDADFKKYFTPSAFDPPKDVVIKPISDDYFNHLNSCARTERSKNEPKFQYKSTQRFYSKPKIKTHPTVQLSKSINVINTPIDELVNRRKLASYMEKQENQSTYYWNPEFKESPKIKKNTYEGPQNHPKKTRKHVKYIDRKETKSVRLRNQAISQKLAVIKEQQYQKEMEDKMYYEHSMKVNREMTPYINFVNSLEKAPPGGTENKIKTKRKVDLETAIIPLKESVSIANKQPVISLRESVILELRSDVNKIIKDEKEEKIRADREKYENRGKFKAKCLELWNPDSNY